jgi:hypothetical protein
MKPRVTILINSLPDLYNASMPICGLDALARRAEIDLHFRDATCDTDRPDSSPFTLNLEVIPHEGSPPRRLIIDLADRSDLYSMRLLTPCDVYLKRNLYSPDLASLPAALRTKVKIFGLNYPCRTASSARLLLQKFGLRFLSAGRAQFRALRRHISIPDVNDFVQSPSAPLAPSIVYQTRIWQSDEFPPGHDESEEINEQRVTLLRALKSTFGDRFKGGLVPTPLALQRYPNDVARLSSKPKHYIQLSKQNLIAIYTRGLFHSTAFKLPECLAASQCIVAEPPRNELPAAFTPGLNYLPFTNAQQCVEACARLLKDAELAQTMRAANHDYYVHHVDPAARMRSALSAR